MQTAIGTSLNEIQLNGLGFHRVQLTFEPGTKSDLFALKNNKTLGETVRALRYQSLATMVHASYSEATQKPLGTFLLECKQAGDMVYKRFLNRYGDETYSRFYLQDAAWLGRKGLYCYVLGDVMVYIGQSRDSFGKRINQGYGNISPKNCYLDGQATNCHVNSLVTLHRAELRLFLSEVKDRSRLDALEKRLIQVFQPAWNVALKHSIY